MYFKTKGEKILKGKGLHYLSYSLMKLICPNIFNDAKAISHTT